MATKIENWLIFRKRVSYLERSKNEPLGFKSVVHLVSGSPSPLTALVPAKRSPQMNAEYGHLDASSTLLLYSRHV